MKEEKPQDKVPPLTITVVTDSATRQYAEQTREATLSALRADILQGTIPRETKTQFETKTGNAKPQILEGTLIRCALRYPVLGELYMPVRRYARAGLGYGIIAGICLNLVLVGFLVLQMNQTFGLAIIAMPICFLVAVLMVAFKINVPIIQTPCMLAAVILPGYLGMNGLFPQCLGVVLSGAILYSMPGMTIGAIVGAVRRSRIPRAYDAPQENVMLRVAIPLVISITIWAAYLILARNLLPKLMK